MKCRKSSGNAGNLSQKNRPPHRTPAFRQDIRSFPGRCSPVFCTAANAAPGSTEDTGTTAAAEKSTAATGKMPTALGPSTAASISVAAGKRPSVTKAARILRAAKIKNGRSRFLMPVSSMPSARFRLKSSTQKVLRLRQRHSNLRQQTLLLPAQSCAAC